MEVSISGKVFEFVKYFIQFYYFIMFRLLEFGKNTSSWMLVAASNNRLLVWNVLSETLLKTIWVQVERLIADPMSEYMVIFTPNNDCKYCYLIKS